MSELTRKFLFYRGDALLGVIIPTHDDFPWHYGRFEAEPQFQSVARLFENELRILDGTDGTEKWDEAYNAISADGLRFEPVGPGKMIHDPLVHIQGNVAWWR